jgi:hypothetical protein
MVHHAGTFLGDTLAEYYKFRTGEDNLLLFLFQQYYHNMKQQYQFFLQQGVFSSLPAVKE